MVVKQVCCPKCTYCFYVKLDNKKSKKWLSSAKKKAKKAFLSDYQEKR